jgi:hypothetical protein
MSPILAIAEILKHASFEHIFSVEPYPCDCRNFDAYKQYNTCLLACLILLQAETTDKNEKV